MKILWPALYQWRITENISSKIRDETRCLHSLNTTLAVLALARVMRQEKDIKRDIIRRGRT